jgi:hypothetical protein
LGGSAIKFRTSCSSTTSLLDRGRITILHACVCGVSMPD